MFDDFKKYIIIIILIGLTISFFLLGLGVWSVHYSKSVSDNTKSKFSLGGGITSIIIGTFILLIILILIAVPLYIYIRNQ
jgi:ABC-type phosphate transport system permease subunit